MCAECRQTPCHPSCPNAEPDKLLGKCYLCGRKIFDVNTYYQLDDMEFCEECVLNARREG